MTRFLSPVVGLGLLLWLDCGGPPAQAPRGGPCTPGTTVARPCAGGSPGTATCVSGGGWTTSCKSDGGPAGAGDTNPGGADAGSGTATDGGPAPTFAFINENLIQGESCGNCHGQKVGPGEAGLDLVTDPYAALVGIPAVNLNGSVHAQADGGPLLRVSPGDPSESLLYIKLGLASASGQWGQPMPMSGPQSTPASLMNALRAWIAAGAPND